MIGSKGFEREHKIQNLWQKGASEKSKKFKGRGVTKTVERRLNPGRRRGTLNNPFKQSGVDG